MGGEVERLAFELAQRSLSQQEHALDELRSRTGTLVAASALATSFLGARMGGGAAAGALTVVALAAFLVSLVARAYVIFPRRRFVFAVSVAEAPTDLASEYRRLCDGVDTFVRLNQRILDRLMSAFAAATLALVVEAILLSIELVVR